MRPTLSTEELLSTLKSHLQNKQPLSIIRYGDGEAITLNGFKDTESYKMVLKRQLGFCPTIEEAEEIRENLIDAYEHCDILGLSLTDKAKGNEKDYWSRSREILQENVSKDILDKKDLVSIDCHSHFLDKGYYKDLMTNLKVVNYISCRNLDEEIKKAFNVKQVNSYIIAPEAKFTSGYNGTRHYPDQFVHIRKWMERAVPCEGNLCLVGAGFIGKIYNNWFRDLGGVSMDIGSIFDSWAGKATRGQGRGLNAIDDTYKL